MSEKKDRSHLSVVAPAVTAASESAEKTPIVLKDEVATIARQLAELTLASAAVNAYVQAQLEGFLRQTTGIDTLSADYNFDHQRGVLMPKPVAPIAPSVTND